MEIERSREGRVERGRYERYKRDIDRYLKGEGGMREGWSER